MWTSPLTIKRLLRIIWRRDIRHSLLRGFFAPELVLSGWWEGARRHWQDTSEFEILAKARLSIEGIQTWKGLDDEDVWARPGADAPTGEFRSRRDAKDLWRPRRGKISYEARSLTVASNSTRQYPLWDFQAEKGTAVEVEVEILTYKV